MKVDEPLTLPNWAERANRWYEDRIKGLVEQEHWGKLITIEINTGDYEIKGDEDRLNDAYYRLRDRYEHPALYTLRIGGGHLARHNGWRMRHLWADVRADEIRKAKSREG